MVICYFFMWFTGQLKLHSNLSFMSGEVDLIYDMFIAGKGLGRGGGESEVVRVKSKLPAWVGKANSYSYDNFWKGLGRGSKVVYRCVTKVYDKPLHLLAHKGGLTEVLTPSSENYTHTVQHLIVFCDSTHRYIQSDYLWSLMESM